MRPAANPAPAVPAPAPPTARPPASLGLAAIAPAALRRPVPMPMPLAPIAFFAPPMSPPWVAPALRIPTLGFITLGASFAAWPAIPPPMAERIPFSISASYPWSTPNAEYITPPGFPYEPDRHARPGGLVPSPPGHAPGPDEP